MSTLPRPRKTGELHHTGIDFELDDALIGNALAIEIGGLFVDKGCNPDRPHRESYFYREMTSIDIWTRVARALRFHGLQIINKERTDA